jgi:hypothetical protein
VELTPFPAPVSIAQIRELDSGSKFEKTEGTTPLNGAHAPPEPVLAAAPRIPSADEDEETEMRTNRMPGWAAPAALALTAVFLMCLALQATPPKDTLVATPGTTTVLNVSPTSPGNSNEWFYAYCIGTNATLSDTIPVQVQINDTNSTSGDSYTMHFSTSGTGLASDLSFPADFTATDDGSTQTVNISLNSFSSATAGNFTALVQLDATVSGKLVNAPVNIHITVSVGSSCLTPPASSCFLTDSEFNDLGDCTGNPVTGNTGGTFMIIANHKSIVSTNPGQFYYNLIWRNTTGTDQTVTFNASAQNLSPSGANSVHAFVFDSSGFTQDLSGFDMVNLNGTPCGPYGPCTITVPNNQILWVTWHLYYSYIGSSPGGLPDTCSSSCSGKSYISATGTLTNSSGTTLDTCTASACGYLKH